MAIDGDPDRIPRRVVLVGIGGLTSSLLAGCTNHPSFPDADVIVGPGGRLQFEPADIMIDAGESVIWGFASSGHNVACRPADSDRVRLPAEADPFGSYGTDQSPRRIVERGETYTHAFPTPGTYRYVCIPHIRSGMVGTITVE